MGPLALLRKEALTVRRNLALFVVLLVVVPGALAAGTAAYDQTLPEDLPVAVAPADDATTEQDLQVVRGTVQFFADPVEYEDRAAAERALDREEVYVAFLVPPGLADDGASVTMTVLSDASNAPLSDPADLTLELLDAEFDRVTPASVAIEHERLGAEQSLSAFLLPSALFALVVVYGLVYVPYQVREERRVLDRLRTETRTELVVASKLLFYGALVVVPIGTVALADRYFGYGIGVLSPTSVFVLFVTFLLLAAVGLAVLFAARLRQAAVFVDLGLALGVLALSGLIYPVGFYSELRREIARSLPTHYALVTLRGTTVRGVAPSTYLDYVGWLFVALAVALVVLAVAVRHYERGGVYE